MDYIKNLLDTWIGSEPVAGLWLVIGSVFLFGVSLVQSTGNAGHLRIRDVLVSLVKGLSFAALAIFTFSILANGNETFSQIYGPYVVNNSLSNKGWQKWQDVYGSAYNQGDLQVTQYETMTITEMIQPNNPADPPLYRNVEREQISNQNSIAGFTGIVDMQVASAPDNTNTYNGYTLTADYQYEIVNNAASNTRVVIRFPLSSSPNKYRNVQILSGGKEVSWQYFEGMIGWDDHLSPGEEKNISVHFSISGMDAYTYEVQESREILNFKLTVVLDTDRYYPETTPVNGGVVLNIKGDGDKWINEWEINRSILTPRIGISLQQGWKYAPYFVINTDLPSVPRASVLFLSLVILTFIICSIRVRLDKMALLAGLYMLPFLFIISGSFFDHSWQTPTVYGANIMWMLPVMVIPSLLLAYFLLRKNPRLPAVLTLILLMLFAGGYPLIGGLMDEQKKNAAETFIQAGMIAYIFGLTLYVRLRISSRKKQKQSVSITPVYPE